ncbi:exocyst complex component 3-like isoform X2 [Acropora millepora]|uniref:exocyst complex component 3-like isoform X1 n=1 Tax=Acropora millepora TaxID=45264 RepID=UPI001CF3AB70|nr:exocyst complex component 3-like isoform X1 [Acropora millepora]XP_029211440.2 exocyst complex component 3-like isoform X2 [Acropora millepora]
MSVDIQKWKAEAHENAAKTVANMLQHPDSLDKVEQWRRRYMRNKASAEARLKTAVQSQLDGVRTGLYQLHSGLHEIKEIKQSMNEVDSMCKNVKSLAEELQAVRECQKHQSQISKACGHLNLIFTVPENVKKTEALISDGKLLLAHKCLSDLEATRDELLFEVHKMSQEEEGPKPDKTPLFKYFEPVKRLSESLGKQCWVVLGRVLSTVRSDPAQLVTALRIVEREERADRRAQEKEENIGFSVPGRPKRWRSKAFKVLDESVSNRFESLEMELQDRVDDKMWLVKHLERTRQRVLDDLIVVKNLCQDCFPPTYNIFDRFIKMYHKALSMMLERLILEKRLDSNECISLLTWIREYKGTDLMNHSDLQIDVEFLGFLLSPRVEQELLDTYLTTTKSNMAEWMAKLADTDVKDWHSEALPEKDLQGFYNTSLPVFLFKMIDQNLQVAAKAGEGIKLQMLDICLEAIQGFQREYRNAIRKYKSKHFEDRSQPPRFVEYMVAIVNNCKFCMDFTDQLKDRLVPEIGKAVFGEDRERSFKDVVACFEQLGQESAGYLLEEVFLDLEPYLSQLMTPAWLPSSEAIETIIATIEDYYSDFLHLIGKYLDYLMEQALKKLLLEYVRALLNKRMAFKDYEGRREAAKKITEESKKIEKLFRKLATATLEPEKKCSVLPTLAEVIKLKDTSMLALEISGLANKYPDLKSDHALALLLMRGDMSRADSRQLIMETPLEGRQDTSAENSSGFFSQIIVPPSLLDKLETVIKKK